MSGAGMCTAESHGTTSFLARAGAANAARAICAQLVGFATAMKYMGAKTGLRCRGLNQTPQNPQGAMPLTELDANHQGCESFAPFEITRSAGSED